MKQKKMNEEITIDDFNQTSGYKLLQLPMFPGYWVNTKMRGWKTEFTLKDAEVSFILHADEQCLMGMPYTSVIDNLGTGMCIKYVRHGDIQVHIPDPKKADATERLAALANILNAYDKTLATSRKYVSFLEQPSLEPTFELVGTANFHIGGGSLFIMLRDEKTAAISVAVHMNKMGYPVQLTLDHEQARDFILNHYDLLRAEFEAFKYCLGFRK